MRADARAAAAGVTRAAALLGLALTGSGCRGGAKASSELERQLAEQVRAQLGAGIAVSCPAGAPPLGCVAAVGQARVPIALSSEPGAADGAVRWRIEGLVVSGPELERQVREQLTSLGLAAEPRCGASLQPVRAGERVRCELPAFGVAWATVAGDGSYSLELALGEAAAARTSAVDEAALDALSRALDREEGTQADADGDGGGGKDEDDEDDDDHDDARGDAGRDAERDRAVTAPRAAGGQP